MKSLNLMPRIPWSVKYFVAVMSVALLLFIAACVGIWRWHAHLAGVRLETSAEYEPAAAELRSLESKTRIKSEDQSLNALVGELGKLNAERRDWKPVLEAISTELPATARLKTAEAVDDTLKLTVQFISFGEAGQYELRLAQNPLFQKAGLTVVEGKPVSGSNASLYEEQLEIRLAPIQKTSG